MGWKPRPGVQRRAKERPRRRKPVNGPEHWAIPWTAFQPPSTATLPSEAQPQLYSARIEMTCFSGEKDSFSAARKISVRIAGKRLCEDARPRAFAAVGGLRPGIHAGYPWTNATARGPFTGLLAGAKHGARASRPQRQMRARCPRSKEESASTPSANLGARASRPQITKAARSPVNGA